jgi:hypothetical protein
MDYERGLTKLGQYVAEYFEKIQDLQLRDNFDLHKFNLRRISDDINQYGSNEKLDSDILRVVLQLNRITYRLNIGMSFDDLCVQSDAPKPISNTRLKKLRLLLNNAFSLPDDDKLKVFYDQCVPPNMSAPQNYQISGLLNCLAKMGKSSTGHIPMLDFVVRLMPYANNPKARDDLKAWIREVGKHLTLTETQIDGLLNKPQKNTIVPLHLLIELEPELDDNFIVSAWRVKSPEDIENISDNIKSTSKEQTFVLNDMPKLIGKLLDSIKHDLIAAKDQLTIEFFLPFNLLCHPVDHWLVSDPFQGDTPIGIRYPVVIRSQDRLQKDILWAPWKAHWDDNKLEKIISDDNIAWMTQNESLRAVHSKLNKKDEVICFAMTFPHETIVDPKQDVLLRAISLGAPIALWPRKIDEFDDVQQELRTLLLEDTLENLPERVRKKREEKWVAEEEHKVGYNLSLLWDDPNRIAVPVTNLVCPTQ